MKKFICTLIALGVVCLSGVRSIEQNRCLAVENEINTPTRIDSDEKLDGTELLRNDKNVPDIILGEQMEPFIDAEMANAIHRRDTKWRRDFTSREEYNEFIEQERKILRHMIGLNDPRVPATPPSSPVDQSESVENQPYSVRDISWQVFDDYRAEGIMVEPKGVPTATKIVIPHAGMEPIDFFQRLPWLQKLAAEQVTRIIIPAIVGREPHEMPNGRPPLAGRHLIHWTAYELGRTLTGYEVQSVLALVDWLKTSPENKDLPVTVAGYGDGALLAFYAAAVDSRIDGLFLAGHFNVRDKLWSEPIDRNVFGLLNEFGDAELATMIAPRPLLIESGRGPVVQFKIPPADLPSPDPKTVQSEFERAVSLLPEVGDPKDWIHMVTDEEKATSGSCTPDEDFSSAESQVYKDRQKRLIAQLDAHNQTLLAKSHFRRREFMSKLDFSSLDAYKASTVDYRNNYYEKIVGKFEKEFVQFNPRSRKTYDENDWQGYDVLIDVFDGLSAGGILLVPKDIKPGEKRPVVVFQHGLSGNYESSFAKGVYHNISPRLAQEGYVVLAMQGMVRPSWFRVPGGRKANVVGKSLFSFIIPQHEQMLKWLQTLPFVQGDRIGFYGISYGGRTAMRVPSVVEGYTLSMCCADFNNWAIRSSSSREQYSYVGTTEYESNEFNMANTYSHAELASLIAPRCFMVERGYFDLCGDAENVGREYAKVRYLYEAQLKIPDRTRIEWFVGGHEINAKGTLEFLDKFLRDK